MIGGKVVKISDKRKQNKEKNKETKKKKSTQELIGINTFSRYGLDSKFGQLIYFNVQPVNIAVLSATNVEIKIRHLMTVLMAIPDIEISCIDASACFDLNKNYIQNRLIDETNANVKKLLLDELNFLNNVQIEVSTARQFMFVARFKNLKDEQILQSINRIEKTIREQGFEVSRMQKNDIKRMLANYFSSSLQGDKIEDYDGITYINETINMAKEV